MDILQEVRLHNFISMMPFIIIIISLILWYIDKKLDKRIVSHNLISAYLKIIYIPALCYSPYWFTFVVGDALEIYYNFMLILGYLYYFTVFFGFGVLLIYGIEFLLKKFMGVELYMDGLKIKWGKYLK